VEHITKIPTYPLLNADGSFFFPKYELVEEEYDELENDSEVMDIIEIPVTLLPRQTVERAPIALGESVQYSREAGAAQVEKVKSNNSRGIKGLEAEE
jgi:hypothetical protein